MAKYKGELRAWLKVCGAAVILLGLLFTYRLVAYPKALTVFRNWVPLAGRTIVVDPGHGGIDGGTSFEGILEKDINLEVGLALKRALEREGANVIMTRTTDTALDHLNKKDEYRHRRDLMARVDIINNSSPEVYLCLHVNSERRSSKVAGPMTFFFHSDSDSKNLAQELQRRIEETYINHGQRISPRPPTPNSNLYILKNAEFPGVLIEMGFITNPKDRELLKSHEFQQELANAMVQALKDYF